MSPEWIAVIVWNIAALTLIFTMDLWINTKFGNFFQVIWDGIERVTTKALSPIARK